MHRFIAIDVLEYTVVAMQGGIQKNMQDCEKRLTQRHGLWYIENVQGWCGAADPLKPTETRTRVETPETTAADLANSATPNKGAQSKADRGNCSSGIHEPNARLPLATPSTWERSSQRMEQPSTSKMSDREFGGDAQR